MTFECSLADWLDGSDKRDLLAGRPASMSNPPTWAVESAKELRRLSALASEGAVELVAALDAALVVMCSGVVGCRRDGALLELRLDRRGPVSGDVAGRRQNHQLEGTERAQRIDARGRYRLTSDAIHLWIARA